MMMYAKEDSLENITIDDGVLSNRDLLNQLYNIAVGIWDFEILGARLELTQLVVEVKDELLLVNAKNFTFDNTTKSKIKESFEKKLTTPRKVHTPKAKDGSILLEVTREKENLPLSDVHLEKVVKLSNFLGNSLKRSKSSSQSSPCSTDDIASPIKKEAPQREVKVNLDKKMTPRKKARVLGKATMKQMLYTLSLNRQRLSGIAVAEVVAAEKQHKAAKIEMMELLDKIRSLEYDNYNNLPLDITTCWIAAHAKQICKAFDLQCTMLRHTLGSTTSSKANP